MKSYNQLIELAKQKKVKHYKRYKKDELEKILKLEKENPTEFYEKYCKGKWIVKPMLVKNSKEVLKFKSLYATAKYFHIYPQTVKRRILEKKPLKMFNGDVWEFFYQEIFEI